jgi:predicted site-specific integrase-resolvase
VSTITLRCCVWGWVCGKITSEHTKGDHRCYNLSLIIAYAMVSSHDQKDNLERQKQVLRDEVDWLVLTHKDMLLRFGAELIFAICEPKNVEIVIP